MAIAAGLTARIMFLFFLGAAGQVGGSLLLGRTEGFTNPLWSAACLSVYMVSFWGLATMIREGGPLSMILPALTAVVPIIVILIAVLVMGESASWARIGVLSVACLMIGFAGTL